MSNANETDRVGYGKPPVGTRFQKGQSGNPGGRPKVSRTIAQALDEALNESITVNVGGKRKKVAVIDLAARTVAHKAAKGDVRAFEMIAKMQARSLVPAPDQTLANPGEPPVYRVTTKFEEGPIEPPDMMRLCETIMEECPQHFPDEWRPLYLKAKELQDFLRSVKHLVPDSLKDLAE